MCCSFLSLHRGFAMKIFKIRADTVERVLYSLSSASVAQLPQIKSENRLLAVIIFAQLRK